MFAICLHSKSAQTAPNFLLRRVIRIYPIYWFFSAIVFVVYFLKPEWVNNSQKIQFDWLSSFLLIPSDALPILSVGWTLIHEMYFYIVFALCLFFLRGNSLLIGLLAWGFVIIFYNLQLKVSYNPWERLIFHPLTLEFIAGAFIAYLYFSSIRYKTILIGSLVISLFLVYCWILQNHLPDILSLTHPKKFTNAGDWTRVSLFAIPAILITAFVLFLEKMNIGFGSLANSIGDSSYSLYLSHILVLSAIGKIWQNLSIDNAFGNYLMMLFLFIASIVFGLISFRYIEKPMIQFTKRFIK